MCILAALMLLNSCDKRPKGVLSDDEMVRLIADIEVAEVYMQHHNSGYYNDSVRDSAVQWALERHGLTKADFDSTMTWYGRNIDEYRDLYGKVDEELASRQRAVTGMEDTDIVSTDLWPYSRHMIVSANGSSDGLSFSLPPEDIQKGDRITWKMRLKGLSSGNILLGVDYDNGTSSYSYQSRNGTSKGEVMLQTDSALQVRRVYGYVRANDVSSLPIWIDSISLKRTPIDSTEYYRIHSQRRYSGFHRRENSGAAKDSLQKKMGSESAGIENNGGMLPLPSRSRPALNKTVRFKEINEIKAIPAQELAPVRER
ncbi:MAG: DUF4296 domain-containing protein [Muribaculaceae bacterium]|nr:DUF4296 domain-containing protein [Muribaculaceae bacterium]